MPNQTEPIQVLLDICLDHASSTKLIDKVFELADALSSEDDTHALVFAQFKQELDDLGLVLGLVPKNYTVLTPEEPK